MTCINYINSEAHQFKSPIVKGAGDALLSDMFKAMKTRAEFTIYALADLLQLCCEDDEICEFIYAQPPPTYQYARFSDWFEPFARDQRAYYVEQSSKYATYQDLQVKANIEVLTQILSLLPVFKEKCAKFEAVWKNARLAAAAEDFEGY